VLIVEDHGYGMIRWKQSAMGFPDFGLSFNNPDFVGYAEAYGAKGVRVVSADQLVETLKAAFVAGGVHLVTVPVDYAENKRVLIDELARKVAEFE
jgi:acetolactate synthase I/II/III large subunit